MVLCLKIFLCLKGEGVKGKLGGLGFSFVFILGRDIIVKFIYNLDFDG